MDSLPNNFEFWAQKRGDSWLSTGWRLRHFKCDVRQRTTHYARASAVTTYGEIGLDSRELRVASY